MNGVGIDNVTTVRGYDNWCIEVAFHSMHPGSLSVSLCQFVDSGSMIIDGRAVNMSVDAPLRPSQVKMRTVTNASPWLAISNGRCD